MALNSPTAASPSMSAVVELTRPQTMPEMPRPMKNTVIMPGADQRSPSQPAGSAARPTSSAPSAQSFTNSWLGICQALSSDRAMTTENQAKRARKAGPKEENNNPKHPEIP